MQVGDCAPVGCVCVLGQGEDCVDGVSGLLFFLCGGGHYREIERVEKKSGEMNL